MPDDREERGGPIDPEDHKFQEAMRRLMGEDPAAQEEPEDEVGAQFKELKDKIERIAGSSPMPEPPQWEYKRKKVVIPDSEHYKGYAVGLNLAYTLGGATLAGWGIGKLIDARAGGVLGQAIGTILGATFGLIAGIWMIIRMQNKDR